MKNRLISYYVDTGSIVSETPVPSQESIDPNPVISAPDVISPSVYHAKHIIDIIFLQIAIQGDVESLHNKRNEGNMSSFEKSSSELGYTILGTSKPTFTHQLFENESILCIQTVLHSEDRIKVYVVCNDMSTFVSLPQTLTENEAKELSERLSKGLPTDYVKVNSMDDILKVYRDKKEGIERIPGQVIHTFQR